MLSKLEEIRKSRKSGESGFTIIEVMIVLAIAGLIMLIVFLAVPALQRNARNTEIRSESARILGAQSEFVSNNNGTPPTASITPNGDAQAIKLLADTKTIATITIQAETGNVVPGPNSVVIRLAARCNTAGTETDTGAGRQTAILYQTETSSLPRISCTNS